jgi:hypothetical protein
MASENQESLDIVARGSSQRTWNRGAICVSCLSSVLLACSSSGQGGAEANGGAATSVLTGGQTALGSGGTTTAGAEGVTGGGSAIGGSAAGGSKSSATGGARACGQSACETNVCGDIVDGCGVQVSCGSCPMGYVCGLTAATANQCTPCVPTTCQSNGADCGYLSDGCAGLLNCGTCEAPKQCGLVAANKCASPQQSAAGTPCANPSSGFCPRVADCSTAGSDTTVTGTVLAPNGTLPIPNALVYVPNGSTTYPYGVTTFVDGVAAGACECGVSGDPLVSTTSNVDGSFTLTGVPVGTDVPLVIQLGRWRRLITIPNIAQCTTVPVDPSFTSLPTRQSMGNSMDSIPLIALSTGSQDALECVLRKMGIEDSQFSNAGGTGRIRFYRNNGAGCTDGGGSCTGTTPSYSQLTSSQDSVDQYDALIFPCDGTTSDIDAAIKNRVLDSATSTTAYVNKGGRAFFTHLSYTWLYNQQPSINLPWRSTTSSSAVDSPSSLTHYDPATPVRIDTTFARGETFAAWLGVASVGALSNVTPPEISVVESRWNLKNPTNWDNSGAAQRWAYYPNDSPAAGIMHVTFDAPWGLSPDKQCGRVLYSDFHVTAAALSESTCAKTSAGGAPQTANCKFPQECNSEFSAQEKVLAYFMFDMTSCVKPPDLACKPRTCADLGVNVCGPQGDGCGGMLDCGLCCVPDTCERICANPSQKCSVTQGVLYDTACPKSDNCTGVVNCYCKAG